MLFGKFLLITLIITFSSCSNLKQSSVNYISDFNTFNNDSTVNAVIEIPAGTQIKYEVDKTTGEIRTSLEGLKPRIVDYLGYPCNYGMIPITLLS